MVGSALGSAVYSLFSRVIPGASGNLIAPVIGKNILTKLLSDQPGILANQMMTEMLKDTKLLETVLEIAMSPEKTLRDLDSAKLRRMYTFFMGSGLVNPDIGFQEFASDIYGRTRDPEERRAQREEAGAAPMVPSRPNPRRTVPTPVPPPQPAAPTPPPVAQAPRPTAPAPTPTPRHQQTRTKEHATRRCIHSIRQARLSAHKVSVL
jgi:hypothetical protein